MNEKKGVRPPLLIERHRRSLLVRLGRQKWQRNGNDSEPRKHQIFITH